MGPFMSLRILIDMNLSPDWVSVFAANGWDAIHWTTVGDPRASDRTIMDWAKANSRIVFTHDLDFGTALALTHDVGPSVIQIRGQDVLPNMAGPVVVAAMAQHASDLERGAIVVVDQSKSRVRILPI